MIFTAIAVSMSFWMSAYGTNRIDIRFSPQAIDKQSNTLFVDIDVRVDQGEYLNLAGQNYRIFYDSEVLQLLTNESSVRLPKDFYSDLQFHEHFENVEAGAVGKLGFDKDLGFANFTVELKNDLRGGLTLSTKDEWVTVVTLQFKILQNNAVYKAIWGREGMSDEYATAFVEFAEWIKPKQTNSLEVDEFIDLHVSFSGKEPSLTDGSYLLGPNPANDFLSLKLNAGMAHAADVVLKDMAGRIVKKIDVMPGSSNIRIDLDDITSSNYILEVLSDDQDIILSEKVVVTK